MINREHDLAITKQAKVLRVSRGSVYYLPRAVPEADLAIMRRLDRLHLGVPLGIPWAEKWPSAQIVRKCCNPDTARMARCRVTICTVLTLRRCRPAPQLRLLCTGVDVVV